MLHYKISYAPASKCFYFNPFNQYMLGSSIGARIGKHNATAEIVKPISGYDNYGPYNGYRILYESESNEKRQFTGVIKGYDDFVIFEIINHFKIRGKNKKSIFEHPYISFPNFEGEKWSESCAVLSYKRQAPFNYPMMWQGRVVKALRDGKYIPLLVTNRRFETLVLSPLNHLLHGTVSINRFPPEVKCGLPRAVKRVDKDTAHQTILVMGNGVNTTFKRWGELIRESHHVSAVSTDADIQLTHLSYWTNAGSSYWYNTHKKKSYDETLSTLKAHHDHIGIAFGSYQLDSWWYQKEGDHYTSGITDWEPKPSTLSKNFNAMLPFLQKYKLLKLFSEEKISYVASILKKPLGCHFKQIANDAVYVKESPDDFIKDHFALPKNQSVAKGLFNHIFDHPKWRLSFVIHDWLQFMNDHHKGFRDMAVSEGYFSGLDEACLSLTAPDNKVGHLTLQLCMTQPHMTLNSATMASVTTIRSTSDSASFFIEGTNRWWWHLYSSPFIEALGKYAFYDNRLSSSSHTHPFSSYAKFEFIWLGLSCGPIGLGDKIGKENIALIQRVSLNDGEIIKPDVPCMPLDKCYLSNPHQVNSKEGVLVYSYSEHTDIKIFYLLAFNVHPFARRVSLGYQLEEIDEIRASKASDYLYLYDFFKKKGRIISRFEENYLIMSRRKFFYHIASPIVSDAAVIGDVSVHVSGSHQLIQDIKIGAEFIKLKVKRSKNYKPSQLVVYIKNQPKLVMIDQSALQYKWKNGLLLIEIEGQFESKMITIIR